MELPRNCDARIVKRNGLSGFLRGRDCASAISVEGESQGRKENR
jgi:hypothetical protein